MNDKQIEKMILDIIRDVDEDHWKFFQKNRSEDWEAASEQLEQMVARVKKKYFKEPK